MRELQQMMALYPELYRTSDAGPYGTRIIEMRPGTRACIKDAWDYASDADELNYCAQHVAKLVREIAEWKARARDHLRRGKLAEAIRATQIALNEHEQKRLTLERAAALSAKAERVAA